MDCKSKVRFKTNFSKLLSESNPILRYSIAQGANVVGLIFKLVGEQILLIHCPPRITSMLGKNTLDMVQGIIVEKDLISRLTVVEDGDWDTPRTLPGDAPISSAGNEGIDTILADFGNPSYLSQEVQAS